MHGSPDRDTARMGHFSCQLSAAGTPTHTHTHTAMQLPAVSEQNIIMLTIIAALLIIIIKYEMTNKLKIGIIILIYCQHLQKITRVTNSSE